MSKTDTPARRIARWARGPLLALLCGCARSGPVHTGVSSGAGPPQLYADPGVRVERPAQGVIAYTTGMVLQTGDVIETADGYAVIDFDRGNVVDLRPNTRLALGSIRLFFGEMFARVVDIATHGGGEVDTEELTAAVEGTQYAIRRTVAPGPGNSSTGRTAVIVRDGHVRCAPGARGAWTEVVIGANLVFRVANARALGPPSPIDSAAETRWAEEVERRLLKPRTPGVGFPIGSPAGLEDDLAFCVAETNRYRARHGKPPLRRSAELEAYAAAGARFDTAARRAHKHFEDTPGKLAYAENECLSFAGWSLKSAGGTVRGVLTKCLRTFYDEGPGGGHYESMMGEYGTLGCGVYVDGKGVTIVQDYGR